MMADFVSNFLIIVNGAVILGCDGVHLAVVLPD